MPTPPHQPEEDNLWRYVGIASELGGALIAPPIVGWLLGAFLDKLLQTTPWLTIGLILCGVVAGLRSLLRMVLK